MIWLMWRQHRRQALFGIMGLAVLAAVLILTGLQMYEKFESTGLAACLDRMGSAEWVPVIPGESCDGEAERFNNAYGRLEFFSALLVFLPPLVGMFWGAPLVAREVEHGTHRLVWTQGVTRTRWALVKFGIVGGATLLLAAGYAALVTWWITPIMRASLSGRFDYPMFDIQGVAPVGYTVFAVALGIIAGAVARKMLPAMAVTLVAFIGARVAVAAFARPHFQDPLVRRFPVATDTRPNPNVGDWILSDGIYDGKGNLVAADTIGICPTSDVDLCGGSDRFNIWTYQPGDRFWLFQYIETGIFVGLAAVLLYLALRHVRRRIA